MAATIEGTIKVNVSKGDFAGVYTGDFAYDDTHLTKVGSEFMTVNGGDYQTRAGLLSFNFRFLDFATGLTPVTYTASDVDGFPDAPATAVPENASLLASLLAFWAWVGFTCGVPQIPENCCKIVFNNQISAL